MAALALYLGLVILLGSEEAGLFLLPGDISLVAAGVQARQGHSSFFIWWPLAAASMSIGASGLFLAVRQSKRTSRVLPVRARVLIRRYGAWGVLAARLLPGLRNATVIAAASARLPYRRFVFGLVPAAAIWSGLLLLIGWLGGPAILTVASNLDAIPGMRLLSIGLMLSAGLALWLRFRAVGHPPPKRPDLL